MKTIKAKMVILLVICTIISTVISGGLTLIGMLNVSNQNAGEIMALECKNSSQEINTTLSRVEQSVDTLAELAEQSGVWELRLRKLQKQSMVSVV